MSIINSLFQLRYQRTRQFAAPLLPERERYLTHLLDSGVSVRRVRVIASRLLYINLLIDLVTLRRVSSVELEQAVKRWVAYIESHPKRPLSATTAYTFRNAAINWLKYYDLLPGPDTSNNSFDAVFSRFMHFAVEERRLATDTIQCYRFKVAAFLLWIGRRRNEISEITVSDVDEYLDHIKARGLKPRSLASHAQSLRALFRYLEATGVAQSGMARCITAPSISRYDSLPKGPRWTDVRKLLHTTTGAGPLELRSVAIAFLCSIYGLRGKEIRSLTLEDFNWIDETFVVRRAKNRRVQEFRIQFEVGEAILRYLQAARPVCRYRELFVTLKPPHRPLHQVTLHKIIKRRMMDHGIESVYYGTHALRHSCATQLLRKGVSLTEIADFLGHSNTRSVCIYAKFDSRALKTVGSFSLAAVL